MASFKFTIGYIQMETLISNGYFLTSLDRLICFIIFMMRCYASKYHDLLASDLNDTWVNQFQWFLVRDVVYCSPAWSINIIDLDWIHEVPSLISYCRILLQYFASKYEYVLIVECSYAKPLSRAFKCRELRPFILFHPIHFTCIQRFHTFPLRVVHSTEHIYLAFEV